jgi:hypothetical protein
MPTLEEYLDKHENKKIDESILTKYKDFDYDNEELFKIDLFFLLENIYNISFTENSRKRLSQDEFRDNIMEKFNKKCIVTNDNCVRELTACHIIPIKENENYDIDNGLLLKESIHRTFDDFYWSINPNTLEIEINKNIKNCGEIYEYNNKKLNIQLNSKLKKNIEWHYNKFIINKN